MSVRTPSRVHGRVTMSVASSDDSDAAAAVAELSRTLGDTAELYAVFVAPGYDLELVGRALRSWCPGRMIGCTSAGNIGPQGYTRTGITAIALSGGGLRARTIPVGELMGPAPDAERTSSDLAALHDMWLSAVSADLGEVGGVLAFDCVLRRLEFESRGTDAEAGRLLADHRVGGFSTYGEQFNGMHMNQTMVAVAFGAATQESERNGRA